MLSRKQQWRRVKCRPRHNNPAPESSAAIIILAEKLSKAGEEEADDEASSTATSSIRSSDSIDSALDEAREDDGVGDIPDELEGGGDCCGASLSLPASSAHARVTFEPVVQVFLVTHKSELDSRAKQALWWTGREAAINKRAWLNHLGQPGCGRQSAAAPSMLRRFGTNEAASSGRRVASPAVGAGMGLAGGTFSAARSGVVAQETVGILGCRCQACLTEGDEYDRPSPPQPPRQQHRQYESYAAVYGRGAYFPPSGGARPSSKSWPDPEHWERNESLEEKGSRSYSPASWQGSSPMQDADEGGVFSAGAYVWDRE